MNRESLADLLRQLHEGRTTPEAALEELRHFPYADLGFAVVDHHRALRKGFPEVIYCEGKTYEQIESIMRSLLERDAEVLATRVTPEVAERLAAIEPAAEYHAMARTLRVRKKPRPLATLSRVAG